MPDKWIPPRIINFSQILIPTGETTRAEYIMQRCANLSVIRSVKRKEFWSQSTLIVGGQGTAKTSLILMYSSKFNNDEKVLKKLKFFKSTTPEKFHD